MFENRLAQVFRQAIQEGDWSTAFNSLDQLSHEVKKKSKVVQMKFLILEQKFLELLEEGECILAFNCLRQELGKWFFIHKSISSQNSSRIYVLKL